MTDAASISAVSASNQESSGQVINAGVLDPFEIREDAQADEIVYPTGSKFVAVIAAACLTAVLVGLENSIINTVVPTLTDQFHTIADIGWYYASYRFTACAFQFMFGRMYTVFSVKSVFLSCLFIFELGALITATAHSSKIFIFGRAVSGLGAGGLIAGLFSMLVSLVPLQKRATYCALIGAVESIAATTGPLLGGVITQYLSWRWCWYISLPIGAICSAVVIVPYKSPRASTDANLSLTDKLKRLDLPGTAIFVPGITSLLLALQWGGSAYGWTSAPIISLFVVSAVLIAVFAWWQWKRGDEATLPPRIVGQRSIVTGMLFCFCMNSVLGIVDYYIPIYFQAILSASPSHSGVLSLPLIIALTAAVLLAGPLTSAFGYYSPFMIVSATLAPVATGLLTTLTTSSSEVRVSVYLAMLGFFGGIGLQAPQIAAQTVLSEKDVPLGIAAIMFAHNFGPAVWVSVAQTIFQQRLVADIKQFAPGVNGTAVEKLGLGDLRRVLGANGGQKNGTVGGVLLAYDKAITQTFYVSVALACLSFIGAAGMEWRSVKKKRE